MKVEKTIVIAAAPDRVWRAWTEQTSMWWKKPYVIDADQSTGLLIEPRAGGRFLEKWGEDGVGYLLGHVVAWLPPQRLAFSWSESDWSGASTLVNVTFEKAGQGTRVTLVHEGFDRVPDGAGQRASYESGWGDLLNKLHDYIEKGRSA